MKKKLKQKFVIIIFGPTAVGKSDFAEKLAKDLQQAQIVNCDLGQFYTQLSIGVAKPDYKSSEIKQHLFDIIDEPKDFNVSQYRKLVFDKIDKIWGENDIPVLVGGSGFYLKSLFFPPLNAPEIDQISGQDLYLSIRNKNWAGDTSCALELGSAQDFDNVCEKDLWETLYKIDPERAKKIDKSDTYRLRRALELWAKTGQKPSDLAPVFDFPSNFLFIFLNKDRDVLYSGIDVRTDQMLKTGWIDEVQKLMSAEDFDIWESFLKKKKLIGYDLIIDYLKNKKEVKNLSGKQDLQLEFLIANIKQKTKNYAKRQVTFWRSLEKQLKKEVEKNKYTNKVETIVEIMIENKIEEFNLNNKQMEENLAINLYIKQLIAYLKPLFD